MKQKELVKEMYKACLAKDNERQAELRKLEFAKILARKAKGKQFDAKWTVFR